MTKELKALHNKPLGRDGDGFFMNALGFLMFRTQLETHPHLVCVLKFASANVYVYVIEVMLELVGVSVFWQFDALRACLHTYHHTIK